MGGIENQESPSSLESKVFKDQSEYNFFHERLKMNDGVTAEFLEREKFNQLKGNFLVEQNNQAATGPKKYTLYLPKDLKIGELPGIIKKVTQTTFGEVKKEDASYEEIKKYMLLTMAHVVQQKNSSESNQEAYDKALKKYVALFQTSFPEEDVSRFSEPNYFSNLEEEYKKIQENKYVLYIAKLDSIKEKEKKSEGDVEGELKEIEGNLADAFNQQFLESFFERGKDALYNHMKNFTKDDFKKLDIKDENVKTALNKRVFEKEEIELKNLLRIEDFKSALAKAKEEGNVENVVKLENAIIVLLCQEIYKYPRQAVSGGADASSPSHILQTKEIICVGKSILAHTFLEELGIEHYGLAIEGHSALLVQTTDGKKLYFDPTNYVTPVDITSFKQQSVGIGDYTKVVGLDILGGELVFKKSNPESALQAEMLLNYGNQLVRQGKTSEAIRTYDIALELEPGNDGLRFAKGSTERLLGNQAQAIQDYMIAISLNPRNTNSLRAYGIYLAELGYYEDSLNCFKVLLSILPNDEATLKNVKNIEDYLKQKK